MSEQAESQPNDAPKDKIPELGEDKAVEKKEKEEEPPNINTKSAQSLTKTFDIHQIPQNYLIIGVSSVVGSILLIITLYFIFRKRDNVNQYDYPIPYIYDPQFKQFLDDYTDFAVQNHVLIVHGSPGIGKTRGLKEFSDDVLINNKLVIDIDFTKLSSFSTQKDLVALLQTSVMNSFKNYDGKSFKSYSLRQASQYLDSVKSTLQNKQQETIIKVEIKDIMLNRIAENLALILTNMNYSLGIITFFDALESMSLGLKPVVILHDPQKSDIFFKSFSKISSTYMHDTKSVAIIVEVSNQTSLLTDYSFSPQYRFICVNEFKMEDAKKLLVDTEKIFTKQQLSQLYDTFGGVGQLYASIHELIRERITFPEAMGQVAKETKAVAIRTIYDTTYQSHIDERLALLKQIKERNEVSYDLYENASFYLLKHGLITLKNMTHVAYSNKVFANL